MNATRVLWRNAKCIVFVFVESRAQLSVKTDLAYIEIEN